MYHCASVMSLETIIICAIAANTKREIEYVSDPAVYTSIRTHTYKYEDTYILVSGHIRTSIRTHILVSGHIYTGIRTHIH